MSDPASGRERERARRLRRVAARDARPGIVLLLVVVIVTISALIGGSVAMSASTEREATSAARALVQARALAWSGVQGVMAELGAQRESLLAGEAPVLTESWELFSDEGGGRGVVRLIDLTEDAEGFIIAEGGLLDLNSATKAMLMELGLDEGLAGRIIASRGQRPFASVADLRRVAGLTDAVLYGSPGSEQEEGADSGMGPQGGLAANLTIFAFDPNIQTGLGDDAERFRGRQRVNLDQPWSARLRDALVERFGEGAAAGVERIMREGTTFGEERDIIATLRRLRLPPDTWADVLDVFTTSDDEYLIGRVDLGTAPQSVLACLPGIDEEQAREIVAARERLGAEAMRSPAWLVTEGILSESAFEEVVDHVTTRCMQWRVRVEAGIATSDQTGTGIGGPLGGGAEAQGSPLRPRVVLEAVIDVSSQRARVAYLRDISSLDAAREVLGDAGLGEELLVPDSSDTPGEAEDSGVDETSGEPEVGRDRSGRGGRLPTPGVGGNADGGREGVGAELRDRRIGRWTTGGDGARSQGGGA